MNHPEGEKAWDTVIWAVKQGVSWRKSQLVWVDIHGLPDDDKRDAGPWNGRMRTVGPVIFTLIIVLIECDDEYIIDCE